jgi:hypothetical protein
MIIPDYKSASDRRRTGKGTPTDLFITNWEPTFDPERTQWQQELNDAVDFERTEALKISHEIYREISEELITSSDGMFYWLMIASVATGVVIGFLV